MNLNSQVPEIVYEIKSHHTSLTLTSSIKEAEDTYRTSPAHPRFKAAYALNTATGKKTSLAFAPEVKAPKAPKVVINVASPK